MYLATRELISKDPQNLYEININIMSEALRGFVICLNSHSY